MTESKILIVAFGVLFLAGIFTASAAHSRVLSATVTVDGMACPFCAYGVEKKLKKVDGVGSISVDLESGKALLTAAEGTSIDVSGVPGAIRKSGFTPGEIQVTATGTVERSASDVFILIPEDLGENFTLIAGSEKLRESLILFAASGDMVKLTGAVEIGPDGGMTITPGTIAEVKK